MGDLGGKVAMVTGASRGLGRHLAERLAREGCRLIVCSRDEAEIGRAASEIEAATGAEVLARCADVTNEDDVANMVTAGVARFGRLDLLVCNAGLVGAARAIHDFDLADWRRIIDVNLIGYFLCAREASRAMMRSGGGAIVQINSRSGKRGTARNSAYAASKGAGIVLTQSLSAELAEHHIRVNCICVGSIFESDLWQGFLFQDYARRYHMTEEQVREKYLEAIPLRRPCTYADVADLTVFLLSERSGYMTGQAVNLTGGEVVW